MLVEEVPDGLDDVFALLLVVVGVEPGLRTGWDSGVLPSVRVCVSAHGVMVDESVLGGACLALLELCWVCTVRVLWSELQDDNEIVVPVCGVLKGLIGWVWMRESFVVVHVIFVSKGVAVRVEGVVLILRGIVLLGIWRWWQCACGRGDVN